MTKLQTEKQLASAIHKQNKQWWTDLKTGKPLERDRGEVMMMIVTELAESVEGIRKNLQDDKIPHRKMEEVEMADAKIRILDAAKGFKIDFSHLQSDDFSWAAYKWCDNKAKYILRICYYISLSERSNVSLFKALTMIEQYCKKHNLDLDGAVKEKLKFNRTRLDHKRSHRLKANGKKF